MLDEKIKQRLDERENKIFEAMEASELGSTEHQRLLEDWKEVQLLHQQMEINATKLEKEQKTTNLDTEKAEAEVAKTKAEAKKASSEGFKAKIEPWLQFGGVLLGGLMSAFAMSFTTERNAQLTENMLEYEKNGIYDVPTAKSVISGTVSGMLRGGKK